MWRRVRRSASPRWARRRTGSDQSPAGRRGRGEVEHPVRRRAELGTGAPRPAEEVVAARPRPARRPRPRAPHDHAERLVVPAHRGKIERQRTARRGRVGLGAARGASLGRLPLVDERRSLLEPRREEPDTRPPTREEARTAAPSSTGSRAGRRHRGGSLRRRRRAGPRTRPSSPRTPATHSTVMLRVIVAKPSVRAVRASTERRGVLPHERPADDAARPAPPGRSPGWTGAASSGPARRRPRRTRPS